MKQDELETIAAPHGGVDNVRAVETARGTAVFRKPTRGEVNRAAQKGAFDPKMRDNLAAGEQLARACIIHPSKETFDAWIEDKPATPIVCLGPILELAGLQAQEDAGK